MAISKEQMQRILKLQYKKHEHDSDFKVTCRFCGKQIKADEDPQGIEYVKTKRGDEFFYHTSCGRW